MLETLQETFPEYNVSEQTYRNGCGDVSTYCVIEGGASYTLYEQRIHTCRELGFGAFRVGQNIVVHHCRK
jgi:hypothetical protein